VSKETQKLDDSLPHPRKKDGTELAEKELGTVTGGGALIGGSFSQVIKSIGDGITQMARKQ
jgi:hypothetical protein